ncbi:MAG TPA: hypothetical protein VIT64_13350 [Ilumatobacteraceae bacterium]|jgi:hypothetical protein
MDERITAHDGRMTAGRKGIPYDWQGVLAHRELEALLVAGAPVGAGVGASFGASVGESTNYLGDR